MADFISTQSASEMKGDIVSALYLSEKDVAGIYVQGVDSNQSRPMAWVSLDSIQDNTLPRLARLGWKLVTGSAKARKVSLCLIYEGVKGQTSESD